MLLLRLANNFCQRNFLPDDFCREKDMKGGLAATFFCAVPLFPSLSPPFPRRWYTRIALHALQRRFCVPSVTFLWEWSRNVPWRCVWRGLGVPLSWREGRHLGYEGRPGNSCTFLQFTVGGNLSWKCLYKGVLPTMQQICSVVGATILCRVL